MHTTHAAPHAPRGRVEGRARKRSVRKRAVVTWADGKGEGEVDVNHDVIGGGDLTRGRRVRDRRRVDHVRHALVERIAELDPGVDFAHVLVPPLPEREVAAGDAQVRQAARAAAAIVAGIGGDHHEHDLGAFLRVEGGCCLSRIANLHLDAFGVHHAIEATGCDSIAAGGET